MALHLLVLDCLMQRSLRKFLFSANFCAWIKAGRLIFLLWGFSRPSLIAVMDGLALLDNADQL